MEKLTESQVFEKVDDLATEEFLSSLVTIARLYGWEGDYIEVRSFLSWIYRAVEAIEPDLEPYEMDEFDNIIIP
jgi:hypothetical protein